MSAPLKPNEPQSDVLGLINFQILYTGSQSIENIISRAIGMKLCCMEYKMKKSAYMYITRWADSGIGLKSLYYFDD